MASVGYSGPLSKTRQEIAPRRITPESAVTLFCESDTQKLFTITVKRESADRAIDRYKEQGYRVRHPGFEPGSEPLTESITPEPVAAEPTAGRPGTPVACLNTGRIFESVAEAASWVGAFRQQVNNACQKPGSTCKGYQFRFATELELQEGYKGNLLPIKNPKNTTDNDGNYGKRHNTR